MVAQTDSSNRIEAVVFDCFGVLYVDPTKHFYESKIPNYIEIRQELQQLNRQADYGFISQSELVGQVAALSGLSVPFVKRHILGKNVKNTELLAYAKELREKGYKIGLLSNVSVEVMAAYFDEDERSSLFDAVVISGEVGMVKPYVEIYQLMSERLGVPIGQCVMIDDSADNCEGAEIAGMRSIHYQNLHQALGDISRLLPDHY